MGDKTGEGGLSRCWEGDEKGRVENEERGKGQRRGREDNRGMDRGEGHVRMGGGGEGGCERVEKGGGLWDEAVGMRMKTEEVYRSD